MTMEKELALFEVALAEKGQSLVFGVGLYRNLYVVAGDATMTDDRLLQRHARGAGCHAAGPLEIRAEAEATRVWVWQIGDPGSYEDAPEGAVVKLHAPVAIEDGPRIMRLDSVHFPPGAAAHTHVHPGPGIRIVEKGRIGIRQGGHEMKWMGVGEPWFETGPDPVFAPTTEEESTTFIRCMILPMEWRGRSTIRYVDPADADKPKLQQYHRFVDATIDLTG